MLPSCYNAAPPLPNMHVSVLVVDPAPVVEPWAPDLEESHGDMAESDESDNEMRCLDFK